MQDPLREKRIRRLKKLLALAQRGCGGEKANARRMLENTMASYSLTLEDIDGDERQLHWFAYDTQLLGSTLITQVIGSVCGADRKRTIHPEHYWFIGVECTEYERFQIQFLYNAYYPALKSELDATAHAFIHINGIFPDQPPDENNAVDSDYLNKLLKLAATMRKVVIQPVLTAPS